MAFKLNYIHLSRCLLLQRVDVWHKPPAPPEVRKHYAEALLVSRMVCLWVTNVMCDEKKVVWKRSDFFDHVKRYVLVCIHEDAKDYSDCVCKRHIYFILLLFAPSPDSSNFRCSKYSHENLPQAMTCVGLMFGQKCLKRSNSNNLPHFHASFKSPTSKALISWSCFHGQFYSYFHRLHGMTPLESWKENLSTCGTVPRLCLEQFWRHGAECRISSKEESQGWTIL